MSSLAGSLFDEDRCLAGVVQIALDELEAPEARYHVREAAQFELSRRARQ